MRNWMLAAIGSVAGLSAATAQDISADANYGEVELSAGFADDPYTVELLAGGSRSADELGANCIGSISDAPDLELTYEAGSLPLYISATSDADVSLVVNLPDGSWACDDDSAGSLNPVLQLEDPSSGVYDIWVGAVFSDDLPEATLYISELGYGSGDDGVEIFAEPSFGEVTLESGFAPDPFETSIVSGGSYDASEIDGSCMGAIATSPDFNLYYSADDLPLLISASSEADITLVINTPDGSWVCDDDSAGELNPGVTFDEPLSGLYNIWVGSYDEDELADSTLYVSEIDYLDFE